MGSISVIVTVYNRFELTKRAVESVLGQTLPVSQTPTTVFHANGQTYPYAGTLQYDVLKSFLDQLVGQK